jgi:hypothetical protein
MAKFPMIPRQDQTKQITVAAASANVQITEPGSQLRVLNDGTATVWIKMGVDNTVTADVATDIPIRAGETEVFSIAYVPGQVAPLWVAAIAAGATGIVYFTPGEGD